MEKIIIGIFYGVGWLATHLIIGIFKFIRGCFEPRREHPAFSFRLRNGLNIRILSPERDTAKRNCFSLCSLKIYFP